MKNLILSYISHFFSPSFVRRLLIKITSVFAIILVSYFNIYSSNIGDKSIPEYTCEFGIYSTKCLPPDGIYNREVCVEAFNSGGEHYWELEVDNAIYSATGYKVCIQFNGGSNSEIKITHYYTDDNHNTYTCVKLLKFGCAPGCESLQFEYTRNTCHVTFTIFKPNNFIYAWDFGDGSPILFTTSGQVTHDYNPMGGSSYNICITGIVDDYFYFTCCFPVDVPACCEESSLDWEQCSIPPGTPEECCIFFTFNLPYQASLYVWDFGDGSPTEETLTPTSFHSFTDDEFHDICVTYTINGITGQCCFRRAFPPCKCCETAEFDIAPHEYNPSLTCPRSPVTVDPFCKINTSYVRHEWDYSDGYHFIGLIPPPHYFTNFINDQGLISITHKVICGTREFTFTKTYSYARGVYIGQPGITTRLTDRPAGFRTTLNPNGFSVEEILRNYSNLQGVPVIIEGILEVNKDVVDPFTNGTWNMGNNSLIYINDHIFNLSGMTIQDAERIGRINCCRWQGLKVTGNSYMTWTSTNITDAEKMLEFINGVAGESKINFTNCHFNENVYGIYSISNRFIVESFKQNELSGCVACGLLCGCQFGEAIYLQDISSPLGIEFPFNGVLNVNTIHDYDIAVHSINTTLKIRNFNIHDIKGFGNLYEMYDGAVHKLTMDNIVFNTMQVANEIQLENGGKLTLTATAIVPYISLQISNVYQAYNIFNFMSQIDGNISYNNMSTNGGNGENFGVKCDLKGSAGNKLSINSNHISVSGAGTTTSGIVLTSTIQGSQSDNISRNTVANNNNVTGDGIHISNWDNSVVSRNNPVWVSQNKDGIHLTNCGLSTIECNYVTQGQNGIYINKIAGGEIRGNNLIGQNVSMNILNDCQGLTGTTIASNTFDHSTYQSTLYNAYAQTQPQVHENYNIWLNQNGAPTEVEVLHPGSKPFVDACVIKAPNNEPLGGLHYPYYSPHTLLTFIMDPSGSPATTTTFDCNNNGSSGGDHLTPNESGYLYDQLITDSDLTTDLDVHKTNALQSIYELILQNPDWAGGFNNLIAFKNSFQDSFIGRSSIISSKFKDLQKKIDEDQANLNPYFMEIDSKVSLMDSLNELLTTTIDSIEILNIKNELNNLSGQINNIQILVDSMRSESNLRINNLLDTLHDLNTSLQVSGITENYEKLLNYIKIKVLNKIQLSSSDTLFLRTISQLCLQDYGNIVSTARELSLSELNEFYGHLTCDNLIGNNIINSRSTNGSSVGIMPNPASEEVYITFQNKAIYPKNTEIYVVDITGKAITPNLMYKSESQIVIKVDELENGLYFLKINSDSFSVTNRLIVSHNYTK